jgi:hypothetical protein
MEWNNSHMNPPEAGQKVYYFGPNIGLWIGHYSYHQDRKIETYYYNEKNEKVVGKAVDVCQHVFTNVSGGVCDACDAPFWLPYDEERAKSWCPIIPEQYTKDLYV